MVDDALTTDLIVLIGESDWLVVLDRLLDGGIAGTATTTFEPQLGSRDEEASVHSVAQEFNFGTVYDGEQSDTLVSHVADTTNPWCVVADVNSDHRSFEAAPVSLNALPRSQPPNDAITRTLSLPQAGRARFGIGASSVRAFALSQGTGSVAMPTTTATQLLLVAFTRVDDSVSTTAFGRTIAAPTVGIRTVASRASSSNTMAATLTGGNEIHGYAFIGNLQTLPTG